MSQPPPHVQSLIRDAVRGPSFTGAIAAPAFDELVSANGGDAFGTLRLLAPFAGVNAHIPVSDYRVGVAALGQSGSVYLGANLELAGAPLYLAVHAEQSAVGIAMNHGESALTALGVNATPCAHCRQFLLELGDPTHLQVVTPDRTVGLDMLVPEPFEPSALGSQAKALEDSSELDEPAASIEDRVISQALIAAQRSHTPYTSSPAGVALQLTNGAVVVGSYIESVAFNPSLDPVRAACAAAQAQGWPANRIDRLVLVADPTHPVRHDRIAMTTAAWLPETPEVEIHDPSTL